MMRIVHQENAFAAMNGLSAMIAQAVSPRVQLLDALSNASPAGQNATPADSSAISGAASTAPGGDATRRTGTLAGGMQTMLALLQQLRALAEQAAGAHPNGSGGGDAQVQADSIAVSMADVTASTQVDGQALMDGSQGSQAAISAQSGIAASASEIKISSSGTLDGGQYSFQLDAVAMAAQVSAAGVVQSGGALSGDTNLTDPQGALQTTTSGSDASLVAGEYKLTITGPRGSATIDVSAAAVTGDSYQSVTDKINGAGAATGVSAALQPDSGGAGVALSTPAAGSDSTIAVQGMDMLLKALGFSPADAAPASPTAPASVTAAGTDGAASLTAPDGTASPLQAIGNLFTDLASGFSLDLSGVPNPAPGTATIDVANGPASSGGHGVAAGDLTAAGLGVQGATPRQALDISMPAAAQRALRLIDQAIAIVAQQLQGLSGALVPAPGGPTGDAAAASSATPGGASSATPAGATGSAASSGDAAQSGATGPTPPGGAPGVASLNGGTSGTDGGAITGAEIAGAVTMQVSWQIVQGGSGSLRAQDAPSADTVQKLAA